MMNKYRLKSLAGLAALIIINVSTLFGCAEPDQPVPPAQARPVKTLVVSGGAAREAIFPARVAAVNQVDLAFRVGGPLVSFPVREGRLVRRGQELAQIDSRDFQIRLDSAQAQLERAEADFRRFSALYEKEAVSEAQLDQSRAARDVARSQVEDSRAALDDTRLKAPFTALVGERFVENFQDVQAKQPILSLVDVSSVDIVFDVPESVLATVQRDVNRRLIARFDTAPGQDFDLRLKEIAAQADPRTQTYRVTFTMPQPSTLNILPGMTAYVHASADESEGASRVLVPALAVFGDDGGRPSVWIVKDDLTVERRSVTTGEVSGNDRIEIQDGLSDGDRIAVTATALLKEGMKIRLLDE